MARKVARAKTHMKLRETEWPVGDPRGLMGRQTDRRTEALWGRRQDGAHGASHGDLGLHIEAARSR